MTLSGTLQRPVPLSTIVSPPVVTPPLPFPRKKAKDLTESKYKKFLKVLKGLHINIPFVEAIDEMPAYAKFLKEILAKKRVMPDSVDECYTVALSKESSALINNTLPEKLNDPGRFAITIGLGNYRFKALCDLGASTSLLPLSIWKKINMGDLTPVNMRLYMADGSCVLPTGVIEDVPVRVGKFFVPNDFIVMDMAEDPHAPIILGRPFLATAGAIIDVKEGRMSFQICDEMVEFSFNKDMKEMSQGEGKRLEEESCYERRDGEGYKEDPGETLFEASMGSPEQLEDPNPPSPFGRIELKRIEGSPKFGGPVLEDPHTGERLAIIVRPNDVRRGRTPIDWEAFDKEMSERAKPMKNPP